MGRVSLLYMYSPQEADEVKKLVQKCRSGNEYDFSRLSDAESKRLDMLHETILTR